MRYRIETLSPGRKTWDLPDSVSILGSHESCQIQLSGPGIAARQARLENGPLLVLKDLRTGSGVYVNGTRVVEALLRDGDVLRIGDTDLLVHDLTVRTQAFPLRSRSEPWNEQLRTLGPVAATGYPVLLLGPSGTGKDVLAQALHRGSPRSMSAFLSVNCSALTETLVESELFGHVKGSFTGAVTDRKGAFESARGGTLFLDEIGDLPYGLQAKLLRALENGEIRPVGSDRTVRTDVRIVAATHQNLYQKIREGSFRADLFYRLNVITVDVPSLRERIDDFDDLVYQFARDMRVRFSHGALQLLKKYEWPGNIRELKNTVARASALFPKEYIEEKHVDVLLNRGEHLLRATAEPAGTTADAGQISVIKEIEKQMILKRLAANYGNQKRTASELGIPKSTLHDRIRSYNLNMDQFRA